MPNVANGDGSHMASIPENSDVIDSPRTEQESVKAEQSVDEYDGKCGILTCAPSWMQRFTQPKWILIEMCLLGFLQGFIINGINNVNTVSFERRFQLSSTKVSAITMSYEISAGILVLPVSYIGVLMHKPRFLGFSGLLLGIAHFCMAMPHLITGPYESGEGDNNELCDATAEECDISSYLSNFIYLLIFGQLLHGFAGAILFTVGVAAIDDNVNDKTSSLYIGIFYTLSALGTALGYIAGGLFLRLYVDFEKNVDVTLTGEDPRWVGAWWLAYMACTPLSLLFGALLFLFPRESPKAANLRALRSKTNPKETAHSDSFKIVMKGLPRATLRIFKQPTFICITLAGTTELMMVSGYGVFLNKFIANQFNQTDEMAAYLAGALVVPGMAGGIFLGGFLTKKFGLSVRGILRCNAVLCLMATACIGVLFAQCPQSDIAGVNLAYDLQKSADFSTNLTSPCNIDCACNQKYHKPVCFDDKIEYFTPCYAGCHGEKRHDDESKEYLNCSCINSHMTSNNQSIVAGKCASSCDYMYVFIVVFFFAMLFTFMPQAPSLSATIRCIADKDKTYALGVQWVFMRFLGSVPGPIVFGVIIDSTCVVWEKICGEIKSGSGSCWIYDNSDMSRNFFLITVACKGLSTLFNFLGSVFYKPFDHNKVGALDSDHIGNGHVNNETVKTTL